MYDQDGTNEFTITASDNTASTTNRKFGEALAIGANKILVGAPGVNNEQGAVYIYNMDGTGEVIITASDGCLLYTSPSPRDRQKSRMPSSA